MSRPPSHGYCQCWGLNCKPDLAAHNVQPSTLLCHFAKDGPTRLTYCGGYSSFISRSFGKSKPHHSTKQKTYESQVHSPAPKKSLLFLSPVSTTDLIQLPLRIHNVESSHPKRPYQPGPGPGTNHEIHVMIVFIATSMIITLVKLVLWRERNRRGEAKEIQRRRVLAGKTWARTTRVWEGEGV